MNRICSHLSIALFVFVVVSRAAEWQLVTPYGTKSDLWAVATDGSAYVAGGEGILLYSQDSGATWKPAADTGNLRVNAIAYGNGTFVAVGPGSSTGYVSLDGKTWQATQTDLAMTTVTFGNGLFVGTGAGSAAFSTNGTAWNIVPDIASGALWAAAYGNGAFVAIVNNGRSTNLTVVRSTNGKEWTNVTVALPKFIEPPIVRSLAFGNGVFGASIFYYHNINGFVTDHLKSPDGMTWELTNPIPGSSLVTSEAHNLLSFVNGEFVQIYEGAAPAGVCYLSANLVDWSGSRILPGLFSIAREGVAGNGNSIVVVGREGYIAHGPDLQNMQTAIGGSLGQLSSVAAVGNRTVGVGPSGLIELSTDGGSAWIKITMPAGASDLESVEYADGKFVAVGAAGTVVRSALGDTWSKRLSNTSSDLHDIVFGNGLWVAVGNAGTVITSTDASFFNLQNSSTQVRLNGVAHGAGSFVAVGIDGAVLNSNNGVAWTARGTDDAVTLRGVAYGDGRFVAVGEGGITHWSSDLNTWHTVRIQGAGLLSRIAFAMETFVAIEDGSSRIFTSSNGEAWTASTLIDTTNYGADAADQAVWVSGENGVIWKTAIPVTEITLGGDIDAQGHFQLKIAVPEAGNYRVFSTQDITGASWSTRDLLPITDRATWTDSNPLASPTFYKIRKE